MTEDCPECGGVAEYVEDSHSIHLYRHTDEFYQCQQCGHFFAARGVADDEDAGFAFYNVEKGTGVKRPTCPEHGSEMVPTKIWPSEDTVQFKCEDSDADGEPCQRLRSEELRPVTNG